MGAYGGGPPPGLSDKQRHQWELNQQIDEQKRYKEQEKQRERELEAKDDQRIARSVASTFWLPKV